LRGVDAQYIAVDTQGDSERADLPLASCRFESAITSQLTSRYLSRMHNGAALAELSAAGGHSDLCLLFLMLMERA
jgi:hypothetical protein